MGFWGRLEGELKEFRVFSEMSWGVKEFLGLLYSTVSLSGTPEPIGEGGLYRKRLEKDIAR